MARGRVADFDEKWRSCVRLAFAGFVPRGLDALKFLKTGAGK